MINFKSPPPCGAQREIFRNPPRPLSQGGINLKIKSGGFALIEVIVSMVILSMVLAAAVGLLYTVSSAVEKNRDRLTATYLAQECLELVRNSRDTAWRNHQKWDCAWNKDSSCSEEKILSSIKGVVSIEEQKTKFSRNFSIENKSDQAFLSRKKKTGSFLQLSGSSSGKVSEEALITCTVNWGEDKLSISEILTNWRKR